MACSDFLNKAWMIQQTTGRVVQPFEPPNTVIVTEPSSGSYTVEVFQGSTSLGTYPGFTCSGSQLDGKVDNNELRLTTSSGTGRLRINGTWNATQRTTDGTWTGEEGGGGKDDV